MSVNLTVNGRPVSVDAEDDTPLLWVLRDDLGLTGTKFGCGLGQCGACTVHLNGEPTRSCTVPLTDAAGATIETIEHLAANPIGQRLQQAWIEEDVVQCGYCQAGQLMAATSLLAATPRPSDAEIDAAMTNLCRCGTYVRIRRAIKRASGQLEAA